jgi:ubiquinone biosynthesis protein Coq4
MNRQKRFSSAFLAHRCFSESPMQQPHPIAPKSDDKCDEPFYGKPRNSSCSRASLDGHTTNQRSFQDRIAIALHSATTAFADPTRADAVATLGDITGPFTLQRIYNKMTQDPTGRLILNERPVVSKATIPYERLIAEAPDNLNEIPGITFGQAYGSFLKSHGFDPDERDDVKYVDDENLAYIMKRYRQVRWIATG